MIKPLKLAAVSVSFALALAGCSDDESSPSGRPDSVKKVIGSAGGEISTSDGTSVSVPSGALDADVEICVFVSLQNPQRIRYA